MTPALHTPSFIPTPQLMTPFFVAFAQRIKHAPQPLTIATHPTPHSLATLRQQPPMMVEPLAQHAAHIDTGTITQLAIAIRHVLRMWTRAPRVRVGVRVRVKVRVRVPGLG